MIDGRIYSTFVNSRARSLSSVYLSTCVYFSLDLCARKMARSNHERLRSNIPSEANERSGGLISTIIACFHRLYYGTLAGFALKNNRVVNNDVRSCALVSMNLLLNTDNAGVHRRN